MPTDGELDLPVGDDPSFFAIVAVKIDAGIGARLQLFVKHLQRTIVQIAPDLTAGDGVAPYLGELVGSIVGRCMVRAERTPGSCRLRGNVVDSPCGDTSLVSSL